MPFELQPVLEGNLLSLRPLRPEDFDELYAVASDPRIWEQHPVPDRYRHEVFSGFFREAIECGGALIASDRKDGRAIGSSRFDNYDAAAREIEIGWTFLARSHWGGGYNREMKHLMLCHAFQFVDRVDLSCWSAESALAKGHGKDRRRSCSGSRRDKSGRDNFMYQITASQYRQSPLLP